MMAGCSRPRAVPAGACRRLPSSTVGRCRAASLPRRAAVRMTLATGEGAISDTPAGLLIQKGMALYNSGDRSSAQLAFQQAAEAAEAAADRRAAKFNEMCVHAAFGDVEVAQLCLRDALTAGLDFDAALSDPGLVRLESSAQIRIQLRKFAEGKLVSRRTMQVRYMEEKRAREGPRPADGRLDLQLDMAGLGEGTDQEIVVGLLKRVGLVLLAAVLGFAVLFAGGYQFLNVR